MLHTIKLRVRDKHAAELARQAKAVNYVWNYANETQKKAVQSDRKWLNWQDLQRLTAGSSKLLGLHSSTIQRVVQMYDQCRTSSGKPWVRFRGAKSLGWVPFAQTHVKIVGDRKIQFRRAVYETMHWRKLPVGAVILSGSFNQDARGRWYVNLPIDLPTDGYANSGQTAVGIDLGVKTLATLSTGEFIANHRYFATSENAYGNAQRAGKKRLARRIAAEIANCRKDYLHKISAQIASTHGVIFVGDVSSVKLVRTRTAKSVLDAGWCTLRKQLLYKAIRHGGKCFEVDERGTSQVCSACGAKPEGRPKGIADLGIREWTCGDCGTHHDRDVNAARNILARGLASLVEGAEAEQSSVRSSHHVPWAACPFGRAQGGVPSVE